MVNIITLFRCGSILFGNLLISIQQLYKMHLLQIYHKVLKRKYAAGERTGMNRPAFCQDAERI